MEFNRQSNRFGRRKYIAGTGAMLSGSALLASGASAQDNQTDRDEKENGILITTSHPRGLSKEEILQVREELLSKSTSKDELILTDIDSKFENGSNSDLIGYYIEWDADEPFERFWSAPQSVSRNKREKKVQMAKEEVLQAVSIHSTSTPSINDDPISADPPWESRGTVTDDTYVEGEFGGETITVGRIDLSARLYEADKSDGKRQFGCVNTFIQWPGDYLDDHDSSVSNGVGFNYGAKAEQNWNVGGPDREILGFAPTDQSSSFGGVDLQSVSFGVSATGASASITLAPSDHEVAEIDNQTDPDDVVRTLYEYGGFWSAGKYGGDEVIQAGNSGVFLIDDSKDSIVLNRIIGVFESSHNGVRKTVEDDVWDGFVLTKIGN